MTYEEDFQKALGEAVTFDPEMVRAYDHDLGEMPWHEYPAVKAWYQKIKSRPSFRALLADRVPGSSPPLAYSDLDF